MKVFVSGCYDLLHSGHIEFFRQAAQYGDLYVGIGSDATILKYKNHKTLYPEQERLFMVQSIRYVKQAIINKGSGVMDFVPTVEELKADYIIQNVKDKVTFLRDFMVEHHIEKEQLAYIGDDLNDMAPMQLAGFIACPADSCQEVMRIADYVSPIKGGYGAVRDVIENMLRYCGEWDDAVRNVYGIGV